MADTRAVSGSGGSSVSMNFDVSTLQKYNNEVETSRSEIKTIMGNINGSFEELLGNVKGKDVNASINKIMTTISDIDAKMTVAFEQLVSFLNGQMNNYITNYANASATLEQALGFINTNF